MYLSGYFKAALMIFKVTEFKGYTVLYIPENSLCKWEKTENLHLLMIPLLSLPLWLQQTLIKKKGASESGNN